jgi:hypothetical protein
MAKLHNIEAQVHKPLPTGYRVKVSVLDLGMYINGFVVMEPNEQHPNWAVYPPKQNIYGHFIPIVEFSKKLPLWDEISEACIEEVKKYSQETKDVVITELSEEPINFDNIRI